MECSPKSNSPSVLPAHWGSTNFFASMRLKYTKCSWIRLAWLLWIVFTSHLLEKTCQNMADLWTFPDLGDMGTARYRHGGSRSESFSKKYKKMSANERWPNLEYVALGAMIACWLGVKAFVPQNFPFFLEQDPGISKPYVLFYLCHCICGCTCVTIARTYRWNCA